MPDPHRSNELSKVALLPDEWDNAAEPAQSGATQQPNPKRRRQQPLDFLLVYDLEASCDEDKNFSPQEIIELACVVVDTRTVQVVDEY